uniref:Uncharacterized protein n=3 Tax=Zea mays TaxID=4577 RepID=A0A804LYS7_MAIZE|eukprot:XP_008666152.1 uncharacterized protein LOC100272265 isoform X2 [Zea mays]
MSPLPPSSDTAVALSPSSMLPSILLPTSTTTPPLPPRRLPRPRHVLPGRNDRSPTVVPASKPKLVGEKSKGGAEACLPSSSGPYGDPAPPGLGNSKVVKVQSEEAWDLFTDRASNEGWARYRRCPRRHRNLLRGHRRARPVQRPVGLGRELESCLDDWSSHSSSAGNPNIPYVVVSKSSIVTAVCKEILGCYRKLLGIPDLLNQPNMSILKQLLQTLQPTENFDDVLSEFQSSLGPCNVDYLYCGECKMLEDIMDSVSSFSYLLSSDVLITIQSIVNSVVVLLDKSGEPNGKNIHMGCSKAIISFLRKRLGYSAHKLLSADFPSEDVGKGWQSKGDLIQKILQIYLRNSDSTSDLLAEIGRELPKAPNTQLFF